MRILEAMLIARSERVFVGLCGSSFAAGAVATGWWSASMSSMPGMPMAGHWTMSMAWMRMPGQGWPGAALSFIGMWSLMMVAMMLPALMPMLRRYRNALGTRAKARLGALTLRVSIAYFGVWAALGVVIFPIGVALASMAMEVPAISRAFPPVAAFVVMLAGVLQFTSWKKRQLQCCNELPSGNTRLAPDAITAWRHGVRLGIRCSLCCSGLTAVLFALGVMDPVAMVAVTAAITLERWITRGSYVAHGIGVIAVGAGLLMMARAIAG